ncbi:hypothetical protein H4R99_004763 [Coemansia sp. RSA 1722]|nr:hypothetical protein H4R99_004763 [Coemansia sp. RSA 1722]
MKVREATSNDPGGPSGALMNEIAQATYNQGEFMDVMTMLDKRLNDKGKNWRHVFKALTVLDYCLHVGSMNVVHYSVDNVYVVKTLREFQHIDDSGRDQGANVRHKAKELTALLLDRSKLEEQRKNRNWVNSRFGFGDMGMNMGGGGGNFYGNGRYSGSSSRLPPRSRRDDRSGGHMRANSLTNPNNRYGDDENEMRQAIAESKRLSASKRVPKNYDEDAELKKAIEESAREAKEEEEKKKKKEDVSKGSGEVDLLGGFDDSLSMASGTNNMNAMSSMNNLGGMNNMGMMSSSSSFFQQQQQFGNTPSATNDLMGAFGGSGQMAGANSAGFDPFGLGNAGGMGNSAAAGMGMGMDASGMQNQGMGNMGGMNAMGMGSTNPYDNSMFSNSSNQFVSQTTMTTTSLALGGTGPGSGNVFGQTSGMGSSNNMLASSGNIFDSGVNNNNNNNTADLLGGLQTNSSSGVNAFDGASGAFGSAFDGGMAAKKLPFGVNPNDPNAKLAEIARNSERIDPFASLATGSSNPFGSTTNASANNLLGNNNTSSFAVMASTPAAMSTTMDFMGTPAMSATSTMMGTPGLMTSTTGMMGATPNLLAGGSSLVDLSPAALATSNTTSSLQTFGQVNRNPFAANGGNAMSLSSSFGTGGNKQMSMNQMMTNSNNNTPGSMMGASANVFGGQQLQQQQQPSVGMNAFGGMQSQQPMQPQQQQQMAFQQQQQFTQQQQINPFSQGTTNTNNQNLFGL